MPLALLEAMAEGVPTLASDIQPHQSLIGDEQGVLFETDNLESCMYQLNWALKNPRKMAAFDKKANQFIQAHHTWEIVTAQTLTLYESLLVPPVSVSYSPARETADSSASL